MGRPPSRRSFSRLLQVGLLLLIASVAPYPDPPSLIPAAEPTSKAPHTPGEDRDRELAAAMKARDAGHVHDLVRAGAKLDGPEGLAREAMMLAVNSGHVELVRAAAAAGAPLNPDEPGYTPLKTAAGLGHQAVVRALLEMGADPGAKDKVLGESALMSAAAKGHKGIVENLIAAGADVNATAYGPTHSALLAAAQRGDEEIVGILVAAGARDSRLNAVLLSTAAGRGDSVKVNPLLAAGTSADAVFEEGDPSPLMEAADRGHLEVVRRLVEAGADVNYTMISGYTPLILAARGGGAEVVKFLLASGARPDVIKRDGESALGLAAQKGDAASVAALLTAGAAAGKKGREMMAGALGEGCRGGHAGVARALLAAGARADGACLYAAACGGHTGIMDLCLEAGVKPNPVYKVTGQSAIECAAYEGNTEAVRRLQRAGVRDPAVEGSLLVGLARKGQTAEVKALLDAGVDVDSLDKEYWAGGTVMGSTALIAAAEKGHAETVRLLLDRGAAVDRKDRQGGVTPLWMAVLRGHTEAARLLVERGANVNTRDPLNGGTPLIGAAMKGHVDIVGILLRAGADASLKNKADESAFDAAKGNPEILSLLRDEPGPAMSSATRPAQAPAQGSMPPTFDEIEKLLSPFESDSGDSDLDYSRITEDLPRARRFLDERLAAHPDDVRAVVLAARVALMGAAFDGAGGEPPSDETKGRLNAAVARLDDLLARESGPAEAHYWAARCYGFEHQVPEAGLPLMVPEDAGKAAAHARRAHEISPDNALYQEYLLDALIQTDGLDEAAELARGMKGGLADALRLLDDLREIGLPPGAVFLLQESRAFGMMQLMRERIADHPDLRARIYRVDATIAGVEAHYAARHPDFSFITQKSEDGKHEGHAQWLRPLEGTWKPAPRGTNIDEEEMPEGVALAAIAEEDIPRDRWDDFGGQEGRPFVVLMMTNYRPFSAIEESAGTSP